MIREVDAGDKREQNASGVGGKSCSGTAHFAGNGALIRQADKRRRPQLESSVMVYGGVECLILQISVDWLSRLAFVATVGAGLGDS